MSHPSPEMIEQWLKTDRQERQDSAWKPVELYIEAPEPYSPQQESPAGEENNRGLVVIDIL